MKQPGAASTGGLGGGDRRSRLGEAVPHRKPPLRPARDREAGRKSRQPLRRRSAEGVFLGCARQAAVGGGGTPESRGSPLSSRKSPGAERPLSAAFPRGGGCASLESPVSPAISDRLRFPAKGRRKRRTARASPAAFPYSARRNVRPPPRLTAAGDSLFGGGLLPGDRVHLATLIDEFLPRFGALRCFIVRRWKAEQEKREPPTFINVQHDQLVKQKRIWVWEFGDRGRKRRE